MELEGLGTLPVGWPTPETEAEGLSLIGPDDIPVTIVIIKDVVTALTEGAVEATHTMGIDGMDVTDITYI